ncbi:MAG: hypothetical protein FJ276_22865 [Planctomycetes bacterium]|nr:hypothetical protein [Planctomycetota bacterium]
MLVAVAPGELIDKITILQIKSDRIADPAKLADVRYELDVLQQARHRAIEESPDLLECERLLRSLNERLWDIEDEIRQLERGKDFGPRFVELARSVYRTNDRRAAAKNRINELLGSRLKEVKDYVAYDD